MIQRIQSIYLLLGAILATLTFAFDIWTTELAAGGVLLLSVVDIEYHAAAPGVAGAFAGETDVWWLGLLSAITTVLGLVTIFLFRNRPLQIKLARLCMLLLVIFVVLAFFFIEEVKAGLAEIAYESTYGISLFLPILALVFFFLASRAIAADEALVRSSERFR